MAREIGVCFFLSFHYNVLGKFHLPSNLLLALSGEVGELCEIFQWVGSLDMGIVDANFDSSKMTHVGEEIADVFIYAVRLSDVCSIDASSEIVSNFSQESQLVKRCTSDNPWHSLSFIEVDRFRILNDFRGLCRISPRQIIFSIIYNVGEISRVFLSKSESEILVGLPNWMDMDLNKLSHHLTMIFIHMSELCSACSLDLGKILRDKITKNEAKYPAYLVRGKSDKYTAYVSQIVNSTV